MDHKLKMTVTMEVTKDQALALQAMFEHWNRTATWGNDHSIGFMINGSTRDDFYPNCKYDFSEPIIPLNDEEMDMIIHRDDSINYYFDYTLL